MKKDKELNDLENNKSVSGALNTDPILISTEPIPRRRLFDKKGFHSVNTEPILRKK